MHLFLHASSGMCLQRSEEISEMASFSRANPKALTILVTFVFVSMLLHVLHSLLAELEEILAQKRRFFSLKGFPTRATWDIPGFIE